MDRTKAIITVRILKKKIEEDLEVPLGITVNELRLMNWALTRMIW